LVNQDCQTEDELKRDLVRFSKWLYRLGFVPGTSGNLSVRIDRDRLLVTPTGVSKYLVRAVDMVVADMEGRKLAGTRKVTSEIGMHLAIYGKRADVQAVIHAHPPIATAFACAGWPLDEMFCQEAVMTLGPVPLARYATTGTDEVAESLAPLVEEHNAILMANHGAVTCGGNLLDAFLKMETLEHVAQIRLAAHQLGNIRTLEGEQTKSLLLAKEKYVRNVA
jgi:L-fuculose-phosphate aldolase